MQRCNVCNTSLSGNKFEMYKMRSFRIDVVYFVSHAQTMLQHCPKYQALHQFLQIHFTDKKCSCPCNVCNTETHQTAPIKIKFQRLGLALTSSPSYSPLKAIAVTEALYAPCIVQFCCNHYTNCGQRCNHYGERSCGREKSIVSHRLRV